VPSGLVWRGGLTVEVFLASRYKSFPTEVGPFFSDAERLAKLVQELPSIDLSAHEIVPATSPSDPAKMLLSKIDERFG
jgi:hypothetical protein